MALQTGHKSHDQLHRLTKHLVEVAKVGVEQGEASYWLRGLVPADWTRVTQALDFQEVMTVGQEQEGRRKVSILGTDGTGTSNDPRVRRCGWSIAYLDSNDELNGWYGNLIGDQTVPRAELTALICCGKVY